jgi:predicted phage terminase large subunit-like protein
MEFTSDTSSISTVELSMEEWKNLCLTRPDAFAHYYFGHILRFPSSEFHFLLYNIIKKINDTPYSNNIAIAAPRGNAKTQIMSIILPIWCAVFGRKKFIILISETGRVAEGNLESIKHELLTNERLKTHFPYIFGEGTTWRKEVIDTKNGVRIAALGSSKQIRGHLLMGGHRPDLVLSDDMVSDESVRTKGRRDDLENWFTKAVMGMKGAGDAKMDIIVTGTILNSKDLLSKLIDPKCYPGWESHKFKAVYKFSESKLWKEWERIYCRHEDDNRQEAALKFFEDHKDEMLEGTKVLWPEGDGYYNLMKYKIDCGNKSFFSEKQNSPLDPSQTLFDSSKIKFFDLSEIDITKLKIYGAIDPASGEAKKKGDLSSIVTVGRDPRSGIIYVLDVMAEERTPSSCIKYMKEINEIYHYEKFGIENDALKIFKEFISKEIPSIFGKLSLYEAKLNKYKRIDRLEPVINSGLLRFQKNQYELLDEVETYPNVEYDDALDALENAVKLSGYRRYRILTY